MRSFVSQIPSTTQSVITGLMEVQHRVEQGTQCTGPAYSHGRRGGRRRRGCCRTPHRHSGPAFGYVIEGAVRFELEGEPERVVEAGGTFWEPVAT